MKFIIYKDENEVATIDYTDWSEAARITGYTAAQVSTAYRKRAWVAHHSFTLDNYYFKFSEVTSVDSNLQAISYDNIDRRSSDRKQQPKKSK